MGIHTGTAQLQDASIFPRYSGYATIAMTQRIMSAGHGGQILLSQTTADLVREKLPARGTPYRYAGTALERYSAVCAIFIKYLHLTCLPILRLSMQWK